VSLSAGERWPATPVTRVATVRTRTRPDIPRRPRPHPSPDPLAIYSERATRPPTYTLPIVLRQTDRPPPVDRQPFGGRDDQRDADTPPARSPPAPPSTDPPRPATLARHRARGSRPHPPQCCSTYECERLTARGHTRP
jgi:hypothetical protein